MEVSMRFPEVQREIHNDKVKAGIQQSLLTQILMEASAGICNNAQAKNQFNEQIIRRENEKA